MNRLNKIVISFVLPFFCLLVSVCNATIIADTPYSTVATTNNNATSFPTSYSKSDVASALRSLMIDGDSSYISPILEDLSNNGYSKSILCTEIYGSGTRYSLNVFPDDVDLDFAALLAGGSTLYFYVDTPSSSVNFYKFYAQSTSSSYAGCWVSTSTPGKLGTFTAGTDLSSSYFLQINNMNVKEVVNDSGTYYWDGETYYYKSESDEPDIPSLPSNAEIAQAVQAFYNSDYYKNNKDFDDFIVMYNYDTKYFNFIGHNFGNKLGQQIIDADVEIGSPPISYSERWWRYFITGLSEFTSTLFNKYYWLYSTNDLGENVNYEGKGSINDLLDLHFSTRSIIVYSTTDYPVNTLLKNDNGETESTLDTIPGDQYTYDETLDPTTNEYNPLENFVPTSPSQSILGDVDFNEINKVFEENKDILNIENASWLFSANNQLVSYFLGFLLLLIVFLIISRVLGG